MLKPIKFLLYLFFINLVILVFISSAMAVEPMCPGGSSPDSNVIWCEDWENQPEAPNKPIGWSWDGNWNTLYP